MPPALPQRAISRLTTCRFVHLERDLKDIYTLQIAKLSRSFEVNIEKFSFAGGNMDALETISTAQKVFSRLTEPNITVMSVEPENHQLVLNRLIEPLGWGGLIRIKSPDVLFRGSKMSLRNIGDTPADAASLASSVVGLAGRIAESGRR